MIRNYFRVIHITIEKIIVGNTQPTHDVLGTSPEGPLKEVLTSGTYEGPSADSLGTNTKIDNWMRNLFFRSNSPCITYLLRVFYRKNKYSKVLHGDVHGTSTGPSCGRSMGPSDGTKGVAQTCFLN